MARDERLASTITTHVAEAVGAVPHDPTITVDPGWLATVERRIETFAWGPYGGGTGSDASGGSLDDALGRRPWWPLPCRSAKSSSSGASSSEP